MSNLKLNLPKKIQYNKMSATHGIPLIPEDNRLTTFPLARPKIYELYRTARRCFWIPEELNFSEERKDFMMLNEKEQHFIEYVLAFFAASDGIVNTNLVERFSNDVDILEVKYWYRFQAMMEDIHAETYSRLLDVIISDPVKKDKLLNAVQNIPTIKKKADWCQRWIESSSSFETRLIAFACVEGIFFSGSFCAIFWVKQRGILKGLTKSNEFISRDEGLHFQFACALYMLSKNKLPKEDVYAIVKDAVNIESEFIGDALPWRLSQMNSEQMTLHIKHMANVLVNYIDLPPVYPEVKATPFHFMTVFNMQTKTDFFVSHPTEYAKMADSQDQNEDVEF